MLIQGTVISHGSFLFQAHLFQGFLQYISDTTIYSKHLILVQ